MIDRYRVSPEAEPAIEAALGDPSIAVRLLAASAAGERGIQMLLEVALDRGIEDEARVEALIAIGPRFLSSRSALERAKEAEAFLVEVLERQQKDFRVAEGAARALGFVGSRRAVAALLPCTKGLTTPGTLKAAAEEAIDAIQARLGGEGGRLSLTEPEGGELSLNEGEEGALSLRRKP